MAEISKIDLLNFPISHNLFSNISANAGFTMLPEEQLANLRGKDQNKNTSKSTNTWLNIFNEWRVPHNEAGKLEDTPHRELDNILCRFFTEIRKRDGHE